MDETYLIVLREDGTPMEALCEGCLIVPLFLHAADAIECAQSCDDDLGKYQLKPVKIAAQWSRLMKLRSEITRVNDLPVAILETQMFPCVFYAGYITNNGREGWVPSHNDTHLFHRTIAEAKNAIQNGRI